MCARKCLYSFQVCVIVVLVQPVPQFIAHSQAESFLFLLFSVIKLFVGDCCVALKVCITVTILQFHKRGSRAADTKRVCV